MRLKHSEQISPYPIILSIGTLRKPTLKDIFDTSHGMSYEKFGYYELFLKMTPQIFYTKIKNGENDEYWNTLSEAEQNQSLYDFLLGDEQLQNIYTEIFNFFFVETVIFKEDVFILLKDDSENKLVPENISGIIHADIFNSVLDIIQQICCISDEEPEEDLKFKNKMARILYEKMLKAKKKQENKKKGDINLTIPNIISSVCAKHPSLNYSNIWDLTIFELQDTFNRLKINSIYDIEVTRVSVWGDEKKAFNDALWYKNQYDSKI